MDGNKLAVNGAGTAPSFQAIVEAAARGSTLNVNTSSKGGMGPSDHMSFAAKKVPVIFFFSGVHRDYHRPGDVAAKINFDGMAAVVDLAERVAAGMAAMPKEQYVSAYDAGGMLGMGVGGGGGAKVTLGVVPDYAEGDTVKGVKISGTSPGSPAEKAGLLAGDVLVAFGDKRIDNLEELFDALSKSKPGDTVHLVLMRGTQKVETDATLVERKG